GATSTCGPAELPGRCWRQRTRGFWNGTGSSGSRRASSSTPTRARSSRTRVARRSASARAARRSRRTSRACEETYVTAVLDPEGAHLAALRRLGDFPGRRVLELGSGHGRLTLRIAADASSVLAFDP